MQSLAMQLKTYTRYLHRTEQYTLLLLVTALPGVQCRPCWAGCSHRQGSDGSDTEQGTKWKRTNTSTTQHLNPSALNNRHAVRSTRCPSLLQVNKCVGSKCKSKCFWHCCSHIMQLPHATGTRKCNEGRCCRTGPIWPITALLLLRILLMTLSKRVDHQCVLITVATCNSKCTQQECRSRLNAC